MGDETTTCQECGGSGQMTCDACDSDNEVNCDECESGSVTSECGECGQDTTEDCDECSGRGYVNCHECYGNGERDCEECGGSGVIDLPGTYRRTPKCGQSDCRLPGCQIRTPVVASDAALGQLRAKLSGRPDNRYYRAYGASGESCGNSNARRSLVCLAQKGHAGEHVGYTGYSADSGRWPNGEDVDMPRRRGLMPLEEVQLRKDGSS